MNKGEFDLIKQYFNGSKRKLRKDVILSIGDDCAVTEHKHSQRIAITTDTMVENTHFLPTISPADLAYKAIATNLSDLAAMGSEPAWISLAITLPKVNEDWLDQFSSSLFEMLDYYNVSLIGGDTTKGDLHVITITAQGIIAKGKGLCRHRAQVGDWVYVSGSIGDSAAGLALLKQGITPPEFTFAPYTPDNLSPQDYLLYRHLRPSPRVLLGVILADSQIANAAIDISDGLIADLSHILERSDCSAIIEIDKLPLSSELLTTVGQQQAENLALSGGEDYELCFTVPDKNKHKLEKALANLDLPYTCIGQLHSRHPKKKLIRFQRNGKDVDIHLKAGFDHFN